MFWAFWVFQILFTVQIKSQTEHVCFYSQLCTSLFVMASSAKSALRSSGHNPRRMIVCDGQGVMKTEGGYAKHRALTKKQTNLESESLSCNTGCGLLLFSVLRNQLQAGNLTSKAVVGLHSEEEQVLTSHHPTL